MMKRTASLALLLACCSSVLAEPLYNWVEADGSITFSPTKPDRSVDYEVIDADKGATGSKIAARENKVVQAASQVIDLTGDRASIELAPKSFTQLKEAPVSSSFSSDTQDLTNSFFFERSGSSAGQQASFGSMAAQSKRTTARTNTTLSPIAQRQHECEDLKKRVVSLERRMRASLTPADRYQRNYDEFCEQ